MAIAATIMATRVMGKAVFATDVDVGVSAGVDVDVGSGVAVDVGAGVEDESS